MLADMAIQIDCAQLMLYRAAANAGDGFPDATEAAKAKVIAADMALKVTNDALQLFGAAGYSRRRPMERFCRDGRMFLDRGGTAQILRTVVATRILGKKLPQTRDGLYLKAGRERGQRRRGSGGVASSVEPWGGNTSDARSDADKAAAFDPLSLHPDFLDNPYPAYRLLRENDPVHLRPDGAIP